MIDMSDKMIKGKAKYQKFIDKEKKSGLSHKDAVVKWKEHKANPSVNPPKSDKKDKRKKPKKKQSGFGRPSRLVDKIRKQTVRSRINMSNVRKRY